MFGINLNNVNYYSDNRFFLNICKQAANWQGEDEGVSLTLDSHGYPLTLSGGAARSVAASSAAVYKKNIPYVLTWDGAGSVTVNGTNMITTPNRIEFTHTASSIIIKINSLPSPNNRPRNFKLVEKEFEGSNATFYQPMIDAIKAFPFSVYRFMDMAGINNSTVETVADAPTTNTYSYLDGAPLEEMIALCNLTSVAGWFSVPHKADISYINYFAETIKDNLDTGLTVYVEHSNETWNYQFTQAQYCANKGVELGLDIISNSSGTGTFSAVTRGGIRYHLARTVEIGNILKTVAPEHNVKVVLGGRPGSGQGKFYLDLDPSLAAQLDYFAVAPYFGNEFGKPDDEEIQELWTPEDIIKQMSDIMQRNREQRMESTIQSLAPYNVPVITYECGQHFFAKKTAANNANIVDLFVELNKHAKMEDFYNIHINNWKEVAGEDSLLTFFSWLTLYNKYGCWGLSDELKSITESPKSKAILSRAPDLNFVSVSVDEGIINVYINITIENGVAMFNREAVSTLQILLNGKRRGTRTEEAGGWKDYQKRFRIKPEAGVTSNIEVIITTTRNTYSQTISVAAQ